MKKRVPTLDEYINESKLNEGPNYVEIIQDASNFSPDGTILNEVEVTTLPNFNLESDIAIVMMEMLKGNKKFYSIIEKYGTDYFKGANPKNIIMFLKSAILKDVIDYDFVKELIDKANTKHKRRLIEPSLVSDKETPRFAGVLAAAVIFELRENPISFAKEIGSKKLENAADEFSTERGKQKFGVMMGNKKTNHMH